MWNNTAETEDISGLGTGTYEITVTDANGCTQEATYFVDEPVALSVVVDNITDETCIGCADGSITIEVSGGTPGYSFLWDDPAAQTTATASGLTADIYIVTLTDANGCIVTAEATVTNPLIVTNTDDSGYGSLRYAINYANGRDGADEIIFNIPNDPIPVPHIIQPLTVLPNIEGPIILDGYTQEESKVATGNDPATLMIELEGSILASIKTASGFVIIGGGTTIKGLAINGFGNAGIEIDGSGSNIITGNHIGTDITGTIAKPNVNDGIQIKNSNNNRIGGDLNEERNIISGNLRHGVQILESQSTENLLSRNWVGISSDNKALGNGGCGVSIESAPGNYVGGETDKFRKHHFREWIIWRAYCLGGIHRE